jgi:hypothetical protein
MSLRALFARATAWTAGTATPTVRVGVDVVLAAFVVAQGPRVIHNLPKWHWEDGRHFHHNRQQIHSIADCFLVPSAWEGGAEATYRPLSANLYYLVGLVWRSLFGMFSPRSMAQEMLNDGHGRDLPTWAAWAGLAAAVALSVWLLERRLRAREVVS